MMSAAPKSLTWLVTGASSGIGQSICKAALARGHRVAGGTRDVARARASNPDFETAGGVWMALDPSHPDSAAAFAAADEALGGVDVLVNNAGYALIGGVEDTSVEDVRKQMEVNYFGPLRSVKALLPAMRARRRGDIVLISSGAGFSGKASRSAYAASKWAAEAMHESLSREVKGLGLDVLIVEPGAFRTAFANRCVISGPPNPAYRDTELGKMMAFSESWSGGGDLSQFLKGDPDKAAKAIVDAVVGGHEGYLRLVLGPDCVESLDEKLAEWERDIGATREVSMSTDLDSP